MNDEYLKHCKPEIVKLYKTKTVITKENIPERMNSYEHNLLIPLMDKDLIIDIFDVYNRENESFIPYPDFKESHK